ncbi:hypothetical protein TruAng_005562 [Truncatella angustata]|nr:hypothetical protein TruAng_005562 [Truncatella angustata]
MKLLRALEPNRQQELLLSAAAQLINNPAVVPPAQPDTADWYLPAPGETPLGATACGLRAASMLVAEDTDITHQATAFKLLPFLRRCSSGSLASSGADPANV